MKIKKILLTALALVTLAPATLALTACKKNDEFNLNAKNVYAMCASSSVEYLKELSQSNSMSTFATATRPENVLVEDINNIKNSLTMFDNIITSGISQKTTKNTSSEVGLKDYNFVMTITFEDETYKMYYNEFNTKTKKEIDDEDVEIETSSTLEGVLVVDGVQYEVEGEREFEEEGRETESSIEFITYLDNENYIVYEQSVEDDEVQYEYTIYKNGNKIQETEFEMEKERNGYTIEFQSATFDGGSKKEVEYEIKTGKSDMLVITLKKNKSKEIITAVKTSDGYTLAYSNGFSENI